MRTFPIAGDSDDAGTKVVLRPTGGLLGRKRVGGIGDKTIPIRNLKTGVLQGRVKKQYYGKSRALVIFKGKPRKIAVFKIKRGFGMVKSHRRKGIRVRGTIRRR